MCVLLYTVHVWTRTDIRKTWSSFLAQLQRCDARAINTSGPTAGSRVTFVASRRDRLISHRAMMGRWTEPEENGSRARLLRRRNKKKTGCDRCYTPRRRTNAHPMHALVRYAPVAFRPVSRALSNKTRGERAWSSHFSAESRYPNVYAQPRTAESENKNNNTNPSCSHCNNVNRNQNIDVLRDPYKHCQYSARHFDQFHSSYTE
jgi:hypothetical protein